MSRLIDADALKEDLLINHNTDLMSQSFVLGSGFDVGVDYVMLFIEGAPSIDLVRCAECRHKRLYDGETKYYYCALEDRPNRNWSVDDWNYCYWGERKESE